MDKVRWGIISTAKIGIDMVIPAMQGKPYCDVTAIASRNFEKAVAAANQLGIPKAYGAYEELFTDPEIDAVYNPLPNHMHLEWTVKALEAGKHVLCEKPSGLNAAEAQEMAEVARRQPNAKLMEAFMYRFHPQWQLARKMVLDGEIGELRTIQTFFSFYNDDPTNIRNIKAYGGGAMMDIGCYAISTARFTSPGPPPFACCTTAEAGGSYLWAVGRVMPPIPRSSPTAFPRPACECSAVVWRWSWPTTVFS